MKILPPDCKILEVGCEAGESTHNIIPKQEGRNLEASEFEQCLADPHLSKGFPAPPTPESVFDMQRYDNEFQWVMLLGVLKHLDDIETALAEIFRVAQHSVIVSVPNEPLLLIPNFARGKYGKVIRVYSATPWTITLTEPH